MKVLQRRLGKLETPTREEYQAAKDRATAHVLRRTFGANLEPAEEGMLEGYSEADFERDCDTCERWRASLDPEKRQKEQHATLSRIYRELRLRGIAPYLEDGEEAEEED